MTGNDMWTFWHIYRKTDNLELRALVALSNLLAQHFGVPPRDVLRTLSQALDGERLDTYAFNYVFFFYCTGDCFESSKHNGKNYSFSFFASARNSTKSGSPV